MALEHSPGLDLSHGFIHMIRKHQLTEAERIREAAAAAEAAQKSARRNIQSVNTPKVKHPDAPLYACPKGKSPPAQAEIHLPEPDKTLSNKLSRLPLLEIGDVDKVLALADIDSFPVRDQDLIKTAIVDIRDVIPRMLPEVAEMLVERAYKDENYEIPAAVVCAHIVETEHIWQESIAIPRYVFRRAIQTQCMAILDRWRDFNTSPTKAVQGRRFAYFVQLAYHKVQPGGHKIDSMLGRVVTRLLTLLLQDVKTGSVEELSVLSSIFHESGADLQITDREAMRDMIASIRDVLFDNDTKPHIKHVLLQIVELHAGQWKLSPHAQQFYFSS